MQRITTDKAPKAIGPYSQAVLWNGVIYVSGQIALDPKTGAMVGSTAAEQAKQCLNNLAAVLEAGGSSIACILKVTIFLRTMDDFSLVNAVYTHWLGEHRPARATVAVSGLPKDALVEIECTAHV